MHALCKKNFVSSHFYRNLHIGSRDYSNQSVPPGYEAVQQLRFLVLTCSGWADSLSNPVTALPNLGYACLSRQIECLVKIEVGGIGADSHK